MPRGRYSRLFPVAPLLLACERTGHRNPSEMLERAELRDAWLGTLLPVAVAGLLVLMLLISWRRRQKGALEGLFRRRSLRDGWLEISARYTRWRDASREQARAAEALAAAQDDAEWRARQAELDARSVPKILSVDGSATLLQQNQRIRVIARRAERDGLVLDITETGLKVPDWSRGEKPEIPWDEVREISVRVGSERRLWIPMTFGLLFAALLGFVGSMLDSYDESAGHIWGTLIGCAVGGVFGSLIMMALPGPRWRKVVDVTNGSAPLSLSTFAARAAESAAATATAAERRWETVDTLELGARLVLMMIFLVLLGLFAG